MAIICLWHFKKRVYTSLANLSNIVMSPPNYTTGHVSANIDKGKAPETAKTIEEHVAKYGESTMTTTAGALNTRDEANALRYQAMGKKRVPNMAIDGEPPASFRKQGDPITTRVTSKPESARNYS
jgi:hypothetical protein